MVGFYGGPIDGFVALTDEKMTPANGVSTSCRRSALLLGLQALRGDRTPQHRGTGARATADSTH